MGVGLAGADTAVGHRAAEAREADLQRLDVGAAAAAPQVALAGAMQELGARLQWSEFVETHVFNSNKVFAVYAPA